MSKITDQTSSLGARNHSIDVHHNRLLAKFYNTHMKKIQQYFIAILHVSYYLRLLNRHRNYDRVLRYVYFFFRKFQTARNNQFLSFKIPISPSFVLYFPKPYFSFIPSNSIFPSIYNFHGWQWICFWPGLVILCYFRKSMGIQDFFSVFFTPEISFGNIFLEKCIKN